ncbi:peptidoglycan-binding protein [Xanthobacter sp. V4C-4]|uniref:peptidoglycan-binding protein n=1 Tax=Xanthobacter cornucopiae TaxID=3119924 RepID=UPI0037262B7D
MLRAIDIIKKLAPKARPAYLDAFAAGDSLLVAYGLTTPLRLAHFLAQVLHETGGLTLARESGSYTAKRIVEVFGVGRHTAAITAAEAARLAGDGPALFERAYGLGNPRKAKELGNTRAGDGWTYRGNGIMQTTGRDAHRRLGGVVGLGALFEDRPEAVTEAPYALLPALAEWSEIGGNALADTNDLAGITKRINGGYNGKADRQAWLDRIYPLLKAGGAAWKDAAEDDEIRALQEKLNALGYGLAVDGRKGPETEGAVENFQSRNSLKVDGIAGRVTLAVLDARLSETKVPPAAFAPVAEVLPDPAPSIAPGLPPTSPVSAPFGAAPPGASPSWSARLAAALRDLFANA